MLMQNVAQQAFLSGAPPLLTLEQHGAGRVTGQGRTGAGEYSPTKGKLVRKRIPQMIRADGVEPEVYVVEPAEYRARLRAKSAEEVAEYMEADGAAYKAFPAPALTMRSARMEDRLRMRVLRCSVGSSIWCAMPMKAP